MTSEDESGKTVRGDPQTSQSPKSYLLYSQLRATPVCKQGDFTSTPYGEPEHIYLMTSLSTYIGMLGGARASDIHFSEYVSHEQSRSDSKLCTE